MAQPRFTGHGVTNPLNPLSLHSENRYREPTPLGSNFMEAETRVFNAISSMLAQFIKKFAKKAGKKVFNKAMKEGATKEQAKIMQQGVERAVKEAMEGAAEKSIAKEGSEEVAEQMAKEAGQEVLEEGLEQTGKEVIEKTAKEAAEEASEKIGKAGFLKTTATGGLGVAIGVGVFAIAGAMGLKGVTEAMEDFAGLNCDVKAEDAGLNSENDEKYTEYVKECQEAAAKRMMALGVTGIVVVGGVIWLLLK